MKTMNKLTIVKMPEITSKEFVTELMESAIEYLESSPLHPVQDDLIACKERYLDRFLAIREWAVNESKRFSKKSKIIDIKNNVFAKALKA